MHVSLTPQEVSANARAAATRAAFQSLLMRYSPSLKGVAVAHRGGLRLSKTAKFVGASPYVHLRATATLLVFSPPRGAELVGLVTYVGPDHVAMSVLGAFRAVLPLDPLREFYAYDYRVMPEGLVKKWRALGNDCEYDEDITFGRQMRFTVDGVKPTQSGLFQIIASLNDGLRFGPAEGRLPLGVIDSDSEVVLSTDPNDDVGHNLFRMNGLSGPGAEEEEDSKPIQVMSAGRRSSVSRARDSLSSGDALVGNHFSDALMTTPGFEQSGHSKKKKRRHSESKDKRSGKASSAKKSVRFEGIKDEVKDEPEHTLTEIDFAVPVLTQTEMSTPPIGQSSVSSPEKSKKTSSREKKKKKKRDKDREKGSKERKSKKKDKHRKRREDENIGKAEPHLEVAVEDKAIVDELLGEKHSQGAAGVDRNGSRADEGSRGPEKHGEANESGHSGQVMLRKEEAKELFHDSTMEDARRDVVGQLASQKAASEHALASEVKDEQEVIEPNTDAEKAGALLSGNGEPSKQSSEKVKRKKKRKREPETDTGSRKKKKKRRDQLKGEDRVAK